MSAFRVFHVTTAHAFRGRSVFPGAAIAAAASSVAALGLIHGSQEKRRYGVRAEEKKVRHLMQSGRFDGAQTERLIRDVVGHLQALNEPVFIVDAAVGQDFGKQTVVGLQNMWAMVAYVSKKPPYGQKTSARYCTYYELKYCVEKNVPIIAVQLDKEFPPETGEEEGTAMNKFVFSDAVVRIDGRGKSSEELAQEISVRAKELKARLGVTDADPSPLPSQVHAGSSSEALKLLAKSVSADSTILELDSRGLGDAKLLALAQQLGSQPDLRVLNLRQNGIGDAGAAGLAASLPKLAQMRELYLTDNRIGDDGGEALAGALQSLAHLDGLGLRGNNIGDRGARALVRVLPEAMSLLDLRGNKLSEKAKEEIRVVLSPRVKRLHL